MSQSFKLNNYLTIEIFFYDNKIFILNDCRYLERLGSQPFRINSFTSIII